MIRRDAILFAGLGVLVLALANWFSVPYTLQILVNAFAYALIALGLNVQWGYAGLFNFGVMGFLMVGGASVTFVSYPLNDAFWSSDGPFMLFKALLAAIAGGALIWGVTRMPKKGNLAKLRGFLLVIAWAVAYVVYRSQIDPAARLIEAEADFVGGLGLPAIFGWVFGGIMAGIIAYIIGKICLGLRTDYLAIATIGVSEIIRALIKNMDWLTRGTLTVSPVPWPTPLPADISASGVASPDMAILLARSGFLAVVMLLVGIIFFFLQRAYEGPWGRMMRAIRDNHIAAGSIGKNVTKRELEIFVLGAVLMGVGGAILTSYVQLLDPSGYQPINHTFIVWVMIIVGGAGNNYGALFGGIFIYIVWTISEPASVILFSFISDMSDGVGIGAIPDIESRALQMRVFVLGMVITLALRYAPQGMIPERVRTQEG
ncbi:branched-chain amino acid ABC transporter permease [Maritalea porphyrae]|jgi:branched-chain amino acid transport system permease protein|uniref:branched-chain amino acid ABC transporter permease n=1 Tax=Maritalea porphyrae TaxID=880732 RepID=UPI0022AF02C7|nr:branched-chain amino acid ABC transporter permease [Maritalea porphyrae]MCZ4274190.1 branched-chain amino acid ABC transporter permease [Maritalea porphyrae]